MRRLTFKKQSMTKLNEEVVCACVDMHTYMRQVDEEKDHYYLIGEVIDKLADYEDAEEQGLLLRLPVAEGTTVFGIIRYFFRGRNENQYEICECKFELPMLREIGKTIFLTREEAESALAEKGGAE